MRASRPVVGVAASMGRLLLGVAATGQSPVARDGVRASRSKSPRTCPSFCGVGPIDVGRTGLKSFLLRDGVTAAAAAKVIPGVPGVPGGSGGWACDLRGVEVGFGRLEGVWGGRREASEGLRFRSR